MSFSNHICPYCHKLFIDPHFCEEKQQTVTRDDSGDFMLSVVIAYETDSAALGMALGGDIVGGIIGQELADSTPSIPDSTPTPDAPSFDAGGGDFGGGGAGCDF